MASNPQQALPWAQTLAGLFGGLVNARQQAAANPRQGFSWLPVLSGGFTGLASGLQGAAQRAEVLRQEGRNSQDALATYAALTGLTPEEVQSQRFGGIAPKEYRADVGDRLRSGQGQEFVAGQLELNDPAGWRTVDSALANTLLPAVQTQASNRAALAALPRARAAGYIDSGGPGTPNEVPIPLAPTITQLAPALAQRIGLTGLENVPAPALTEPGFNRQLSRAAMAKTNPVRKDQGGVGQPSQMQPLVGTGGLPPVAPGATRVYQNPNEPQMDTSEQPMTLNAAASRVQPMTLYEAATSSPDIKALQAMYNAASTAANNYNTQTTQRYNTAQQIQSQNERAVLDFNNPTTAWILAYGTPEQKAELMQYAETGARSARALYGLDKPATRSEITADATAIQNAANPQQAQALIDLAKEKGTLTQEQGEQLYNSTRRGQRNPIGGESQQESAPNLGVPTLENLYPGIGQFLPTGGGIPAYSPGVPRASQGAVNRVIRENSGVRFPQSRR